MAKKHRGGRLGITPKDQPQPEPQGAGLPTTGPGSLWELMYGPPQKIGPRTATKAPPPRPAAQQTFMRPTVDVDKYMDTKGLFEFVRKMKADPAWRAGIEAPLLTLANPSTDPMQVTFEVAQQFKLPEAEIQRYGANAWQYLIEPFVRQLEKSLNLMKPSELPGTFKFQFGRDRSYGLSYGE